MKKFLSFGIIFPLLLPMIYAYDPSKMLIIFFTKTNNTKKFSEYIKRITGIESYQIVPLIPYIDNSTALSQIAIEERNNNSRPEIEDPLTDINNYNTILLGYPLWHSHIPNILITQIEKLNWEGKTIYPFNTHGSSELGSSIEDIKQYALGANVKDGFPISQQKIKIEEASMSEIKEWVKENFEKEEEEEEEESLDSFKILKLNYFVYFILIMIL